MLPRRMDQRQRPNETGNRSVALPIRNVPFCLRHTYETRDQRARREETEGMLKEWKIRFAGVFSDWENCFVDWITCCQGRKFLLGPP